MAIKLACTVAALAALAACGKAEEAVSQKAAEKVIESSLSKDGTTAKVDLGAGSMKVTTTDAAGKTATTEIGAAQVTEAEVGVPFYPGTRPADGGSMRVSTPDGNAYTVHLQSDDGPEKVSAFYREKLKAQAEGKQFMDMAGGDGSATFMLQDDAAKSHLQIHVAKGDKGSDIQIVANRAPAK